MRRRRPILTRHRRRGALRALAAAVVALAAAVVALAGCAAPQRPGPTADSPIPTAVPPATLPPLTPGLGPAKGVVIPPTPSAPAVGATEVQAQLDRALSGQDRVDLTNLLRAAERTGDEAQRYRAYVGAWQYARDLYFQKGQLPEQKALLDALEAVGRSFPQYQSGDFVLDPAASR